MGDLNAQWEYLRHLLTFVCHLTGMTCTHTHTHIGHRVHPKPYTLDNILLLQNHKYNCMII